MGCRWAFPWAFTWLICGNFSVFLGRVLRVFHALFATRFAAPGDRPRYPFRASGRPPRPVGWLRPGHLSMARGPD